MIAENYIPLYCTQIHFLKEKDLHIFLILVSLAYIIFAYNLSNVHFCPYEHSDIHFPDVMHTSLVKNLNIKKNASFLFFLQKVGKHTFSDASLTIMHIFCVAF